MLACRARGEGGGAVTSRSACTLCRSSSRQVAIISGRNKPLTASGSPLTSCRGCPPQPPPCRPWIAVGAIRYFSESSNLHAPAGFALSAPTPHRTHSRRDRSTPAAAADSGANASDTSTHAQTLPAPIRLLANDSATKLRPLHSGPAISVIAPIGSPPSSTSSNAAMPVGATGRIVRIRGVSADGIRCASALSIWRRRAEDDRMKIYFRLIFALSLPTVNAALHTVQCTHTAYD